MYKISVVCDISNKRCSQCSITHTYTHTYRHTHAHAQVHVEEEVARGEAVGAVWAITGGQHDTTALCVRDSELVRMSKSAFKVRELCVCYLCVRDSELVRMSKSAFKVRELCVC